MEATTLPAPSVLHPRAAPFTVEARGIERRIGLLFASTGIALVLVMGVLGLLMRLSQARVISLSPGWFYRLLTLHGTGMLTGALLVGMGALWYVLHATVPLSPGRMLTTYALSAGGAVAVLVATLVGGFGAGWTFLPPLPFYPAGQWSMWAAGLFFVGNLLVGAGFFVFCVDVLQQTTGRYGGLTRTLGWRYLFGREDAPPPPQAIAATVVAIDGLLAATAGTAILAGLLGRTYDHAVGIDALVAKNLVYFFGHSVANLTIYLAVGSIYVLVPRYAGRPYPTTKVFVAGWMGSLLFIAIAYSHHLYMDFVQPTWAQVVSETASYAALIPVAVITIYSMTMLVWGSRYQWTLASTLLYVGFAGWAIGGTGAVIDSVIPINFRFHNTAWVVAHFHTYLILCVVVWAFAFLAHLLERDAGKTSSKTARGWTVVAILIGGYGLTATWFVAGVLGVPRRYAIQPPGTTGYSLVGAVFGLVLACGFLALLVQLVWLARSARARRHLAQPAGERGQGAAEGADREGPARSLGSLPLASPAQLGLAVAACVVGLSAFFPTIVDASETGIRYHHLDHAGQFFFGATLGLLLGSLPPVSQRLGDRSSLGLRGGHRRAARDDACDGASHLRAARAAHLRARRLPPRHGRTRPDHRARRHPTRARRRTAHVPPRGRDAAHVRCRHDLRGSETAHGRRHPDTREHRRALALARGRPRRRRRHPRPARRRLRHRLPPRPASRTHECSRPVTRDHDDADHPGFDARAGDGHPGAGRHGQEPLHRRRLFRLPLAQRRRRRRSQLQGPARKPGRAEHRPVRDRRRRLPRAVDHKPRRADRQGLPRRHHAACHRRLRPRRQAERPPRPRRLHQVPEVIRRAVRRSVRSRSERPTLGAACGTR
jgi:cytochrome c oxidase subunit 1